MSDYADRYTDRKISEVDKRLRQVYRTAQKELKAKLADFNRRSAERDKVMRQMVADKKISEQDYKDWLTGQIFIRDQWKNKISQVSGVMNDHNRKALGIINNSRLDVFAENYNYLSYQTEKAVIGTSFNLYNADAVTILLMDNPKLLPEWNINEKKDYEWNEQKVNNIVTQGIIQGESIDRITKRLAEDLSAQSESRMRTFARTAMTGAENAGRQRQMSDSAQRFKIQVNKRWEATHDSRTRDSHRRIDGEEVPYDEDFSNGLEYPGDMNGEPEEVYNCRCIMLTIYPEYEDYEAVAKRYEEMEIDGQSYEEWKEGKSVVGDVVEGDSKGSDGLNLETNADEKFKSLDYEEKIEEIKRRIENHKGEWSEKGVSQIGGLVREAIEDRTSALAIENAGVISEKEKQLEEATKNTMRQKRKYQSFSTCGDRKNTVAKSIRVLIARYKRN